MTQCMINTNYQEMVNKLKHGLTLDTFEQSEQRACENSNTSFRLHILNFS